MSFPSCQLTLKLSRERRPADASRLERLVRPPIGLMPQLAPKKHAASATLRPLILQDEVGLGERLEAGAAQKMGSDAPIQINHLRCVS
jgi:hypothetical protein